MRRPQPSGGTSTPEAESEPQAWKHGHSGLALHGQTVAHGAWPRSVRSSLKNRYRQDQCCASLVPGTATHDNESTSEGVAKEQKYDLPHEALQSTESAHLACNVAHPPRQRVLHTPLPFSSAGLTAHNDWTGRYASAVRLAEAETALVRAWLTGKPHASVAHAHEELTTCIRQSGA
jgi:hypothetical protein